MYLVSFLRYSEILIENRDFLYHLAFDAPVRGVPVGILRSRLVWKKRVEGLRRNIAMFVAAKSRLVWLLDGVKV